MPSGVSSKQAKASTSSKTANHGSLTSIVSHLIRSSLGSAAATEKVADDELDKHVAELLLSEAREKEKAWGVRGNKAYIEEPEAPVRKPNTRFLASIIKSVDGHNSALRKADEESAKKREREERKAAEEWRRSQREEQDRKRRHRPVVSEADEEEDESERRRRRRRKQKSEENGGYKDEVERSGSKLSSTRRDEYDDERKSSRRDRDAEDDHTTSSSRQYRKDRHPRCEEYQDEDEDDKTIRHRSRRHKEVEEDGDQDRRRSRRDSPRQDEASSVDDLENKESASDPKGKKRQLEVDLEGSSTRPEKVGSSNENDAVPTKRSRRSPEAPLPSSAPPPPPPGPPPSKMDKYFSPTYDPRFDVSVADLTSSNGIISAGAFDSWDTMLRVVKEKKEEKKDREAREKEARRRERELVREERRRKKNKKLAKLGVAKWSSSEGEEEGPVPASQSLGSGSTLIEGSYRYVKKGGTREWDSGKTMELF